MIRDKIIASLKNVTGNRNIQLEFSGNEEFGDYSSNIAMTMFPKLSKSKGPKSSRELAEKFVEELQKDENLSDFVEKIDIAGPGFINFWLNKDILIDNLIHIDSEGEKYGQLESGKGKTVVVDYSSPNIAKPFGVGHLRSTIIGQALYNLYKSLGYEVIGDNHLGDWGTQFGKLIYMINKEHLKDFDIDKLEELYVEFHKLSSDPGKTEEMESGAREWFKKLEKGNPEAKQIWQKCVDVSLEEFDRIYDLLGIKIDFAFGESYYESEMEQMIKSPEIQKYLSDGEEGAKIIDLTKFGIKTPLMFIKSDGATTYATRDLAAIIFRVRKWNPDLIIYEVGTEQSLHFKQLFAAARLMGLIRDPVELVHTAHGLYLAPDGKKFSTREGKTIKLEDVLNEAIERARKLQKDRPASAEATARQVGIGAIKYFDLMHSVQSDVVFNWEKMMNLEGNSGPYLQYTVARTNSVLAKALGTRQLGNSLKNLVPSGYSLVPEEYAVLRILSRFTETIIDAAKNYSPNILCNYLFDLAQKYNNFYNVYRIIGSESEVFRLSLTSATGQVLKNGLKLLGIETPEKM